MDPIIISGKISGERSLSKLIIYIRCLTAHLSILSAKTFNQESFISKTFFVNKFQFVFLESKISSQDIWHEQKCQKYIQGIHINL